MPKKPLARLKLKGGFKVPSLRNIAETAPYMHSGRFETLREVAAVLQRRPRSCGAQGRGSTAALAYLRTRFNSHELDRLVDFMRTLSDSSLLPSIPQSVPSGHILSEQKISEKIQ